MTSDGSQQDPTYHRAVASFASLRPPMAYTINKDKKQVEHNFTSIIRARARCALPMPMEFHPIAWLHIPLNPVTGAADSFTDWNAEVILRILATVVQRLGGRTRGESPSGLRYPYVCDTSRMYCDRTKPRAHSARILNATTCWSKPELVDLAVYRTSQRIKAKTPSMAKEPNRKAQHRRSKQSARCAGNFSKSAQQTERARRLCWRRLRTRNPDLQELFRAIWRPRIGQ